MHHLPTARSSLLAVILCALVGFTPGAAAEVTVVDAGGRTTHISDASRILSIGGDVTEILYALGKGGNVVGVDSTSQFPPETLQQKHNVGYMRALSSEGVIAVGATVVIASERSGPPEVVQTLKATNVPYVEIADQNSAEGIAAKLRLIARVVSAEAEGEKLVEKLTADFCRARAAQSQDHQPCARTVCARGAERPRSGRRPEHERGCDSQTCGGDQRRRARQWLKAAA
jgi:iron complex transport system substrate-binding protein